MDAKRNGVQPPLSVWSVSFDLQFQMDKSESVLAQGFTVGEWEQSKT